MQELSFSSHTQHTASGPPDTQKKTSHLGAVDLVSVVVNPLERLSYGDGDDVRHDGHEKALDRKIPPVAGEAADAVNLHSQKKKNEHTTRKKIRKNTHSHTNSLRRSKPLKYGYHTHIIPPQQETLHSKVEIPPIAGDAADHGCRQPSQ